jgi:carbonic anhydrase
MNLRNERTRVMEANIAANNQVSVEPQFSRLVGGYRRFRAERWSKERSRWETLAKGQSPKVMVVACSDSRVDPATIFDTSPGEMFVVRNVANLVPPFERDLGRHGVSAALEFAVTQLLVTDIIVMGHGNCGGIAATLTQKFDGCAPGEGGFIARWIDLLDGARHGVVGDTQLTIDDPNYEHALHALEREAIKVSLENLRTFPCVSEREQHGSLRLHGAFFALDDGVLSLLDPSTGSFEPA